MHLSETLLHYSYLIYKGMNYYPVYTCSTVMYKGKVLILDYILTIWLVSLSRFKKNSWMIWNLISMIKQTNDYKIFTWDVHCGMIELLRPDDFDLLFHIFFGMSLLADVDVWSFVFWEGTEGMDFEWVISFLQKVLSM